MENLKILCDTDVIIEYLKGNEATKDILNNLENADIALSAIYPNVVVGTTHLLGVT